VKLAILMYHRVEIVPERAAHPRNFVPPALFRDQLAALRDWGYRSITLDDWLAYRDHERPLPSRPLIVTFDDGYRSIVDHAWPLLRAHGFHATTFVVTGQIGGTNVWDRHERQEPLLSADDVIALRKDGMRFGSHTRTHRPLTRLSPDEAEDELRTSRRELSDLLGEPVSWLAYPFNNHNRALRETARRAGYTVAVRGTGRMNWRRTHPLALRRIGVDYRMSVRALQWRLRRERWLRV
jgi:peptidoglycan/xylan/chitin deacetylase (PgdA/CDA1 family)